MEQKIYEELCKLFNFNPETKRITYEYNSIENYNFFKDLLFQFCFLSKEGSIKFEDIYVLWFYKSVKSTNEIKLYLEIIEVLIYKSNNMFCDLGEKYISLIKNFLDTTNKDNFEIFIYLQSIYSGLMMNSDSIFFPLFYTILFDHSIILENLKNDFDTLATPILDQINFPNFIEYKYSKEFLKYFNMFLYSEEKKIRKIYNYLCSPFKKNFDIDESNDYIKYFPSLKSIILSYKKKFNEINDASGNISKSKNEIILLNKYQKEISTKNSSDDSNTEANADKNNPENINYNEKKNSEKEYHKLFSVSIEIMDLKELISKIPTLLKYFDLNKKSIDKYKELSATNLENKLLINKLSTTILFLQNANIINIKRKILETLIFEIMEKYNNNLCFSSDYFPSKSNLQDLSDIISEIRDNCKNENRKNEINEDLIRLNELIGKKLESKDSYIYVNECKSIKIHEQIRMTLEFLRYCKKRLHPFVHCESKNMNLYLLPKSLFESNIKYSEYIFSLEDIIKSKNFEDKEIKNNSNDFLFDKDFEIYKKNKEISINNALKILFSDKSTYLSYLREEDVELLKSQKSKIKQKKKIFNSYYEAFIQIALDYDDKYEFVLTKEIKENEGDLIINLNEFNDNLSKVIKDKINRNEGLTIINIIRDKINYEIKEAKACIKKVASLKFMADEAYIIICSKINRIHLIIRFIKEQIDKFYKLQQNIYQEFENSCNEIIKLSERIKEMVKKQSQMENINFIDDWIKTNPKYKKKYLVSDVIINNLRELLSSIKLDINYSYDERFILWSIKNGFSNYLKN